MDIKIEMKIESPDIVRALMSLAEALGIVKEEVKTGEAKEIKLEDVRLVLAKHSREGKQGKVRDLINRFGGNKLTDIPKERYEEILREVKTW